MGKDISPRPNDSAKSVNLREALEERYLAYALSTITGRALPYARHGLRLVNRRILRGITAVIVEAQSKVVDDGGSMSV